MKYKRKPNPMFTTIGNVFESHQAIIRCKSCGKRVKVKNLIIKYCEACAPKKRK